MDIQKSTKKTYIFGKNVKKSNHGLSIGKFYALDGSYGKDIFLDVSSPHIISVFGKRGYGKSYTMGVFIEEISSLPDDTKNDISVIVIDTLGIYWTMAYPNTNESCILNDWYLHPKTIDITVYTPQQDQKQEKQLNSHSELSLPVPFLSSDNWCKFFNVEPTSPFGIALINTIYSIQKTYDEYSLEDIFNEIKTNPHYNDETKRIAENYFQYASSLGIFSGKKNCIDQLLRPGSINILDISMLPGVHIKQMITGLISEIIFQKRVHARKQEEQNAIQKKQTKMTIPKIWMFLDEAQLFLPKTKNHFCKTTLIEHWLRQGRQPGLSMILATQQPSNLDKEVFSHSDLIFCHRLTSQQDINTLHELRPSYMHDSIASIIEKMGHEKGVCNIIDDTREQAHICKIRPRTTWHGGNEPTIGQGSV